MSSNLRPRSDDWLELGALVINGVVIVLLDCPAVVHATSLKTLALRQHELRRYDSGLMSACLDQ